MGLSSCHGFQNNISYDYQEDKPRFEKQNTEHSSFDYFEQTQVKVVPKKEQKVSKKVIIAYNSIIKHSIYSKNRYAKFYEASTIDNMIRYPGKELTNQYLILIGFQNFYANHDTLGVENLHLIFEHQKELLDLAMNILNDRMIDHTKSDNFDECLQTIVQFYQMQDQINAYNEAVLNASSNKFFEKTNEFVKLKEETIKIVRKENDI